MSTRGKIKWTESRKSFAEDEIATTSRREKEPCRRQLFETQLSNTLDMVSSQKKSMLRKRDSLIVSRGDTNEELATFINYGWDVHHTSPLFDFEGTDICLKQYSIQLQNYCAHMKVEKDIQYKVKFQTVDVGSSAKDKIIKVEVQCSKDDDDEMKQMYLGFLMSWRANGEISEEFLHLPVLLCRAKTALFKTLIHNALQNFFDCVIFPYVLKEMQMIWLNSLLLSISSGIPENNSSVVRFTYYPVWDMDKKHKCNVNISLFELKNIWARIHPENNDIISLEEARMLHEGIIKTISKFNRIKYTSFRIHEIKYPDVTVSQTGKFFCKNVETVNEVLLCLYHEIPYFDALSMSIEDTV